MEYLNYIGAALTILLGLLGFFAPKLASRFVSLEPVGKIGLSELRATYGGFFLALGVACFLLNSEAVFLVVGVAWLGAAGGRVWSLAVDRSYSVKNVGGVAFEGGIGLLCIA